MSPEDFGGEASPAPTGTTCRGHWSASSGTSDALSLLSATLRWIGHSIPPAGTSTTSTGRKLSERGASLCTLHERFRAFSRQRHQREAMQQQAGKGQGGRSRSIMRPCAPVRAPRVTERTATRRGSRRTRVSWRGAPPRRPKAMTATGVSYCRSRHHHTRSRRLRSPRRHHRSRSRRRSPGLIVPVEPLRVATSARCCLGNWCTSWGQVTFRSWSTSRTSSHNLGSAIHTPA
jgi:hypothetical protein